MYSVYSVKCWESTRLIRFVYIWSIYLQFKSRLPAFFPVGGTSGWCLYERWSSINGRYLLQLSCSGENVDGTLEPAKKQQMIVFPNYGQNNLRVFDGLCRFPFIISAN